MHALLLVLMLPGRYGLTIKGSIFLKNRHFIIQERFNKLIYGIHTIIKGGTWQLVKFQLVFCSWNEMIFYCISELMLPTLIQKYNKKSFHFWSSSKARDYLTFYKLSDATFYNRINTMYYQFIKPSWLKKKSIFEEYGAFRAYINWHKC